MNCKEVERILRETAYVRVGGTAEEERCADEFAARLRSLGLDPVKE